MYASPAALMAARVSRFSAGISDLFGVLVLVAGQMV